MDAFAVGEAEASDSEALRRKLLGGGVSGSRRRHTVEQERRECQCAFPRGARLIVVNQNYWRTRGEAVAETAEHCLTLRRRGGGAEEGYDRGGGSVFGTRDRAGGGEGVGETLGTWGFDDDRALVGAQQG